MRSSSPATAQDGPELAPERSAVLAEWTVHLARAHPRKLWGVAGGMAAAALVGAMAFRGWVGAVLGPALVGSAVAEFLLPIRYRLTEEAAHCSYGLARLAIPWSSVRRLLDGPDGVRLSPFRRASRLDAFRGVELRFGPPGSNAERDRILAIVTRMTQTHLAHGAEREP